MAYEVSFGQWMVARRRELRLQRTELAAQVGCAAITLRKIETDERRPSLQLATILAERLGLAPQYHAAFVRVARGELPADYLPILPLTNAGALATPQPSVSAAQRAPIRAPLRTNLPAPLTSFVGREQELEAIPALIESQRLVTLTGVGGVGKTRLATEIGIGLVRGGHPLAPDGVWIVELAALAQPTLVAQAIAQVFRLPEQGGLTMVEVLQEHLAEQRLLLILDNCEHLVDVCAEIAEQLLQRCWQLHILATSREPLRVPGERAFPIMPLTLPGPSETQPAQVLSTTAAQLFVARMDSGAGAALAVGEDATARIDSADTAAIAQICRQLDGIPLALELAAPLSQSMPLSEIASQLQNQMAILTNAYRTAIPRHQTMHSALVWSYRLLAPSEQQVLASVSVFAGGWTLEAAQAVCAEIPAARVQPMLTQLVAKSLVLEEGHGQQRRSRMLEPVRQFALVQLQASGRTEGLRLQHVMFFVGLAEATEPGLYSADAHRLLGMLRLEIDNLRGALAWSLTNAPDLAGRLSAALIEFWSTSTHLFEGVMWVERTLVRRVEMTPLVYARLAMIAEAMHYESLQPPSAQIESLCQDSIAIYREFGDQFGLVQALVHYGAYLSRTAQNQNGDLLLEESMRLAQNLSLPSLIAKTSFWKGCNY